MEGRQVTSTLASVKQDPLPDTEFAPPKGFEELKMPDLGGMLGGKSGAAPKATASPKR